MFTKIMLAITGHYDWPKFFPIPIEAILLPSSFPINFYSLSVYGRANLTPIMILADKKYQLKTRKSVRIYPIYLFVMMWRKWIYSIVLQIQMNGRAFIQ